jgi:osmotically-inducible protein OsmY
MRFVFGAAGLGAVLLAAVPPAAAADAAPRVGAGEGRAAMAERSDAAIRHDAEDAILRYPYYTVFDSVELGVDHGVLFLGGSVQNEGRRRDIERRVARVAGVREVRNTIAVQSASLFDERLRYQLLRRIYGDERFAHYGIGANPPIRIVVDRGRVTLTGYVASPVDRALIGHIARGLPAFAVDNRLKVEGEAEEEPGSRRQG